MDEKGNEKNLTTPEFKTMIGSLTSYLATHLQLKELPTLKLVNSRKNADEPFGKSGYYDHNHKQITIFITDRHNSDIFRTLSHEMVHHWQNMRGTLQHGEGSGAGDESNGSHYAQLDPWLRKREMEAYLFGSILFRDWQDEQRMGPPKVQPFLPHPYD